MDTLTTENLSPEENQKKVKKRKGKRTVQLERIRTAFERELLAWVSTSITLSVLGVGAYEIYYNRSADEPWK